MRADARCEVSARAFFFCDGGSGGGRRVGGSSAEGAHLYRIDDAAVDAAGAEEERVLERCSRGAAMRSDICAELAEPEEANAENDARDEEQDDERGDANLERGELRRRGSGRGCRWQTLLWFASCWRADLAVARRVENRAPSDVRPGCQQ